MHLFPTRLLRTSLLASALVVSPVLVAQPTPPAPPKSVGSPIAERPAKVAGNAAFPGGESRELADARIELARRLADVGENHPGVIELQTRIAMLERLEPKKISLDFPGGPLSRLVETVSSHEGISFSVINAGEPADFAVELPPFALRNANVRTIASVVRNLLLARGFEFEPMDPEPNAIVGTVRRIGPGRAGPPARTEFESFQLAPFLGQQSVDDIIAALRAAWELDARHERDALKLKFHPPTSLLLVAGPGEAIALTRNVLSQLKGTPARDQIEPDLLERRRDQAEQEIQRRRDAREHALFRDHPETPPPPEKK